jgi:hypothetical protein
MTPSNVRRLDFLPCFPPGNDEIDRPLLLLANVPRTNSNGNTKMDEYICVLLILLLFQPIVFQLPNISDDKRFH